MVVAQLWSFANDLVTEEQGKRLFALVALGATLGAALGSTVAAWLIEPLGRYALLLVSAAILVGCAFLFVVSERRSIEFRERHSQDALLGAGAAKAKPEKRERPKGAFALVVRHRYLLAIALFTLVFSWANTNGEYMFGKLVKAAATEAVNRGELKPAGVGDFIGRTYAEFFTAVNVLAVFFQAFVVSRIAKYGGTGPALFVLPFISLANGLAVIAVPMLAVLRVGKTLENATDYSMNNTVRQMLWLPTTYEMKFKAKQAVDTFFVRIGDVSSALLVYVGAELLAWSVRGFAAANVSLAAAWLFFAWRIGRESARLSPPPAAPNTPAAASGEASA
jgi:AAA family ATP:ADP antiporter